MFIVGLRAATENTSFKKLLKGLTWIRRRYTLNGNESTKEGREEWKRDTRHTESENHKGKDKSNYINNNTKHDWVKQPNIKTEIIRVTERTRSNDMLPIG